MVIQKFQWLGWVIIWALLGFLPASGVWADSVSVPVLRVPVAKGTTITADMLREFDVSTSKVFASTLTDAQAIVGLQAVRSLAPGVPLNRLHLRAAPLVARGSAVPFEFRRGGLLLRGSGTALQDGALGETIRVLNPATRATLNGVVGDNGVVTVN